ncbi:MAG: hypothetical protein R3F14_08980 [Polyangiaceae bacterium]
MRTSEVCIAADACTICSATAPGSKMRDMATRVRFAVIGERVREAAAEALGAVGMTRAAHAAEDEQ